MQVISPQLYGFKYSYVMQIIPLVIWRQVFLFDSSNPVDP